MNWTLKFQSERPIHSVVWHPFYTLVSYRDWWRCIAMKNEPMEHNIYFAIQPLDFLSRILGISPFLVDPNYTLRNKCGGTFCHIIQATVMILLLLYGLYNSVLTAVEHNESTFKLSVRVVCIINILFSSFTGILALLFTVTRNRNYMTKVLCLLSRVDSKLFRDKSKQSAYSQHRSHVIMQLWVMLIIYGIIYTQLFFIYCDGTWISYMNMCSEMFKRFIDTVVILQYINIVLMVKQRYQLVKHLLSEAVTTDDANSSRHVDAEYRITKCNNKTFLLATNNLKIDTNSNNLYTIRDLRLICSELCDVLHANNKSYEVLILFDVITLLTITVPTAFYGVMTIKCAIVDNGPFQLYLKGVSILSDCALILLTLLWLTTCCQRTTEEMRNIFVCVQKLLLYPNTLGWSTSEMKSFSSQLKNSTFEFNVCGFFTLNLQFFCASVSVIFTYILVLSQFS